MEKTVFWEASVAFLRASIALARCQDRGFRGTSYRTKHTDMSDPNAKFRDVVRRNVRDSAHRVLKRLSVRDANARAVKAGNNLRELRIII